MYEALSYECLKLLAGSLKTDRHTHLEIDIVIHSAIASSGASSNLVKLVVT
jgi:hypothetical protein